MFIETTWMPTKGATKPKRKVVIQPCSSFVLFAWQCKHAPNTIKILSQGLPKIQMSQLIHVGKRAAPP
jgi:hypothetical protein